MSWIMTPTYCLKVTQKGINKTFSYLLSFVGHLRPKLHIVAAIVVHQLLLNWIIHFFPLTQLLCNRPFIGLYDKDYIALQCFLPEKAWAILGPIKLTVGWTRKVYCCCLVLYSMCTILYTYYPNGCMVWQLWNCLKEIRFPEMRLASMY